MPNYTVMEAEEVRRLPAKDNFPEKAVDNYTLKASGSNDLLLVTAFRKLETPIPSVGSILEGEIGEQDRFDPERRKFKKAWAGKNGGGFRGRSPEESRRIERQHAQHMALEYIRIKASIGGLPEQPNGKQGFDTSDVFKLADAFDRDLNPAPSTPGSMPFDDQGLPSA